jgi:hypothetical protein
MPMAQYNADEVDAIDLSHIDTARGKSTVFYVRTNNKGNYKLTLEMKATGGELAQVPVSIFINNVLLSTITINGTGEWHKIEKICDIWNRNNYIKLYFAQSGMTLGKMTLKPVND